MFTAISKTTCSSLANRRQNACAFTLMETLMSLGILGVLVLIVTGATIYCLRSFAMMNNYVDMDSASRNTLDMVGRDIRDASGLLAFTNTSTLKSLTFTNSITQQTTTLVYDANAQTLVVYQTGQPAETNLTQCYQWNFSLYTRAPDTNAFSTNIVFYSTTNASLCKVVDLTWECSRTVLGVKMNSENVETAQIVLRNKVD
jgi:hypothetical protein